MICQTHEGSLSCLPVLSLEQFRLVYVSQLRSDSDPLSTSTVVYLLFTSFIIPLYVIFIYVYAEYPFFFTCAKAWNARLEFTHCPLHTTFTLTCLPVVSFVFETCFMFRSTAFIVVVFVVINLVAAVFLVIAVTVLSSSSSSLSPSS